MIFFKPFILQLRTSPVRYGELWFNCNLQNRKSILTKNIIRTFRTKKKIYSHLNFIDNTRAKNVCESFQNAGSRKLSFSKLWKPFFFMASFSAGTFAMCTIWQYENMRNNYFFKHRNIWDFGSFSAQKHLPWRKKLNREWNKLKKSERLFITIFAANAIIFLAWKIPKFNSFLMKYFTSNPASSAICWPLVLSTFSHYNIIHILMNMYALHSFLWFAVNSMGVEQTTGLYLAGGAISSFVSLFYRTLIGSTCVSIGASGAILAIVAYVAAEHPDLRLSFIGIPVFTFTAKNALTGLIAFDLAGLFFRGKFIDHASHLGGVFCGLFWFYWGKTHIWQNRESFINWWHELRTKTK